MVTERKLINFREAAQILGLAPQGLEFHWYRRCKSTCPCRSVTMGELDPLWGRRYLYLAEIREWAKQRQEALDKG